jgi:hypothetical protein
LNPGPIVKILLMIGAWVEKGESGMVWEVSVLSSSCRT